MRRILLIIAGISILLLIAACTIPNEPLPDEVIPDEVSSGEVISSEPELKIEKELTAFSFTAMVNTEIESDIIGQISGTDIVLTVPTGTNLNDLAATFITTGVSVIVDGISQISGVTENSFISPVTYSVTAEDGTEQDYKVTVEVVVPSAMEDNAFSSTTVVGGQGHLTLLNSSENITMIYANNIEGVNFPIDLDDSSSAILNTKIWIAETEFTNGQAAAVLKWAYDHNKFSSTAGDHNSLDAAILRWGGQQLIDFSNSHISYDGEGNFSIESGFENHPVAYISWYGAVMFCNWLTEMRDGNTDNIVYSGIDAAWTHQETVEDTTQNGYRLPTNFEWEYAARYRGTASTNTVSGYENPYYTKGDSASGAYTYFDDTSDVNPKNSIVDGKDANDRVAVYNFYWIGSSWVSQNPSGEAAVKSLGLNSANALGLYDMSGNVAEWCFTQNSDRRFYRGGTWYGAADILAVGLNSGDQPWYSNNRIGLRLCRTSD